MSRISLGSLETFFHGLEMHSLPNHNRIRLKNKINKKNLNKIVRQLNKLIKANLIKIMNNINKIKKCKRVSKRNKT